MKTIEELEALVETVTRERDLSLFAWESAGMTGRDAQSAMLELARKLEEACEMVELQNARLDQHHGAEIRMERERDEARETIVALTTAKAEADLEIATLTAALDERDVEAERGLEQYDRLVRENATLNSMLDGRMPDTWREDIETLTHQLADATNESTHFQVMCKREGEEIERLARQAELLTDERDELLVRVANQDAELRATRAAYRDAYRRGAEAMRDECIGAACGFFMGTTGFCNGDEDELEAVLEALPIPEEP
jgi:hypothetical protein